MSKNFSSWPEGWPKELNYSKKPVHFFLENTAKRVPNRIAIHFGGMVLTYGELKSLVDRFATALFRMGIQKGDRMAIHLPNCPQFAIAYYALLKIGGIFTPLSPLLSPGEAEHQLTDSGARALLTLDLLFPGIKDIIPKTGVKDVISTSIADCYNAVILPTKLLGKIPTPDTADMVEMLKNTPAEPPETEIDISSDLAHIAYTGGTTGVSKGVMLTHRNLVANLAQSTAALAYEDGDIALAALPFFHIYGMQVLMNGILAEGCTVITMPRFDLPKALGLIQDHGVACFYAVPPMVLALAKHPIIDDFDLSSLRFIFSGAAPLGSELSDEAAARVGCSVTQGYGMTELSPITHATLPGQGKPGSVGVTMANTEIRIVSNDGVDQDVDGVGELWIRGPQVMSGYLNNEAATAETIDADQWLHTGDVAKIDSDGHVYIVDRVKELIKYKGFQVPPAELEALLLTHACVADAAVIGVEDLEAGELPKAFIVLKPGQEATADDIMDFVGDKVSSYKKIRLVEFRDDIPKSASGKILRRFLRDEQAAS